MSRNVEDDYEIIQHSFINQESPTTTSQYWNRKYRIKWTITLFLGCFLVYSSRTTLSICSVEMGKEFGWDKRLSVCIYSN